MNTSITALQQKIEQETGLAVTRIASGRQLEELLDAGLAGLYKDVFAGPPYNEKFEIDEVKGIFRDFFSKKGTILVATDPQKGNAPVAFVVSVPLRAEFEFVKIAKEYYADPETTAYFAEDGVAESYRRQGISGRMKALLLEANSVDGLKQVLLRTSTQNYAQISAVNKAGGRILLGQFQKVLRTTIDDKKEIDNNLFYLFDRAAKKQAPPKVLQRVIVVQGGDGKNRAFVFGENKRGLLAWRDRQILRSDMRNAYPDIAAVKYVADLQSVTAGRVLFDGRMYVGQRPVYSRTAQSAAAMGHP